jgi:hypothetical protein
VSRPALMSMFSRDESMNAALTIVTNSIPLVISSPIKKDRMLPVLIQDSKKQNRIHQNDKHVENLNADQTKIIFRQQYMDGFNHREENTGHGKRDKYEEEPRFGERGQSTIEDGCQEEQTKGNERQVKSYGHSILHIGVKR